ncbi:MAG: RDD family protein [Bacilli bacterium]
MKKNKEKYFSNTISFWKRVGSYIADLVLFLIASILVYSVATYPIISSTTKLKDYYNVQVEKFNECRDLLLDSNLLRLDEEGTSEKELKDVFKEDLVFFVNEDYYKEDGSYNDIFYYFFLNFAPNNLTHENDLHVDYTMEMVNKDLFKVDDEDNNIFALNNGDYNLPLKLQDEAKAQLNDYLNTEINATSQQYFDDYLEIMNAIWSVSTAYILNSNEYLTPANSFNNAMNSYYLIHSIAVIITYIVCYSLYFILVPLLTKNRQTLAKKILRIGIFEENFTPASRKKILVRALVQMIFTFGFSLFIPIMQVGMGILYMPLFVINGKPFYYFTFNMIILAFLLCDTIYMLVNINHRAIEDKLLRVLVIKDSPEFLNPSDLDSGEEVVEKLDTTDDGSQVQ